MRRALAPDLARGLMLLLIVLSNAMFHLWAAPTGPSGWHPVDGSVLDRVVQVLMIVLVDLRTYPLFAFLFGYGLWWSYRRRVESGGTERAAMSRVRRRCAWLVVFGGVHAALLLAGDILGAYGLVGLVLASVLLRRADRTLLVVAGVLGTVLVGVLLTGGLLQGLALAGQPPGTSAPPTNGAAQYATGRPDLLDAAAGRLQTWIGVVVFTGLASVVVPLAAVLGILAARRGLLEHPERHRRALRWTAVLGIAVGWAGALPAALAHVGLWRTSDAVLAEGGPVFLTQWATGLAGGLGYAALVGLLAVRLRDRPPGRVRRAVAATGRRSMSAYLTHSILLAPLLAAWGLGWGAHLSSATVALVAVAAWATTAGLALACERQGLPGPAEALLGRLVDGRRA